MMVIVLSLSLIALSCRALLHSYRSQKQKQALELLFNGITSKPKVVPKQNESSAFEKMVAKNSIWLNFLRQLQEQQLWKFYSIVIVFSILFFINQLINFIAISQQTIVISLLVIVIFVIIAPEKIMQAQTAKKIRVVSKDLPLIIDIMAIMVKSGMTVENGFSYLSTRVAAINRDISTILERACMMMAVKGIEPAIDLIYKEVPSKEMRLFCVTLKRSIGYGNSIYDALLELSAEIRELQRLEMEENISAISAKMTLPMMVFILAPVLVVIAGPIFMNLMSKF